MEKKIIFDESMIPQIAQELITLMPACKIFTFTGGLGAGKTTLIQSILQKKGIKEPVTSPTFTYLNVYENKNGEQFYHFDLYRMSTLDAFLKAGFDEYLYVPGGWTFIEWPAPIMPLLKKDVCHCFLDYVDNKRMIEIKTTNE